MLGGNSAASLRIIVSNFYGVYVVLSTVLKREYGLVNLARDKTGFSLRVSISMK